MTTRLRCPVGLRDRAPARVTSLRYRAGKVAKKWNSMIGAESGEPAFLEALENPKR